MTRIKEGNVYVEHRTSSKTWRNWWLVTDIGDCKPKLRMDFLTIPKEYIGKHIRLKIEEVELKKGSGKIIENL